MAEGPHMSDRDMSPLTDVDTESYASEEYTEDEGRMSSGGDSDEGEDMIKAAASSSASNVTIGNKNTGRHLSRKSTTAERLTCSTGGNLPSSCTDMPQKKKVRDHKLYMQEEQCHKLWVKHRERLGYRKQTMTEPMSAYKANVLAPLLKALLDEPDDVIFSARAMPSEEYEQLLFLGYPWLEHRIHTHKQLTFPGPWSLRAPIFDTACSKCRRGNIRCEARAIGACINDPAGRKKYYGLSCKYCLASNSRGCDAWMHCWDVPYPLWSSRDNPNSSLKCVEGQLAVKEDVRDKLIPEKQESMIATASPIASTECRKPPLFLDLRTCAQIWRKNRQRLGYRERLVSESLDDYISNVLAPLRDAILIEPDDIVFSARAMSSHAYKRLLLLEYPWLEVTEAKYSIKSRAPSLEHWSLKAPVFDDACARCRRDNIRCEAKAIGMPVYDPQGHKKYAGHSLSCKYCAAIQASPCGAWMRCWGDSNPWVAPEHVMKNDLKHERVRMRIKSASEVRTRPVQKQPVQKVRAYVAPRPEMNRQQHILEEAQKKDKEKWEKERALVHDSAVARSSTRFAGGALQVGPPQPQSVPSTSSGKERLPDENQGRTQWIDRSGVDVQMQEQELPANLTTSASMLDVDETLRIGEDWGQEFPAVEGFDSFSPTAYPLNERLSSDPVFPDPLRSQLICDSRDSPVYSDNMHHSNNPHNDTSSGKRSFETAFGVDTIHERDADAPCLSHSLPTAESLRARTRIQQENIEEDLSLHPFLSEEEESTSGDPIDASLSTLRSLKETFIDVIRQLQVDKANLAAELEGFKMNSKRLAESEARYKQENSQLKAEKRKLEESLKQSLLKGAEADERVKLVHRIVEETRRNWQIPKS